MKLFICLTALAAVALADKPDASPVYKAKAATTAKKAVADKKADPRSDTYGAPSAPSGYGAPAPDTYGSPAAPAQDEYGSPQAPVQDEYGSPQAAPVTSAPAAGSVGTQGFYYYYYPVASSYEGGSGSHGGGSKPGYAAQAQGGGDGGLSPIVLILGGLGLLVLLGLLAAAVGGGLGRSFQPDSLLSTFSGLDMDDLTETVYKAVRAYQGVEHL